MNGLVLVIVRINVPLGEEKDRDTEERGVDYPDLVCIVACYKGENLGEIRNSIPPSNSMLLGETLRIYHVRC